jgi:hypothetical protein
MDPGAVWAQALMMKRELVFKTMAYLNHLTQLAFAE